MPLRFRQVLKDSWKEVNQGAETNKDVKEERQESYLRFTSSPWKPGPGSPIRELMDDEWSDLLLELTLATAYANLIQNTPMDDVHSVSSFLAFFGLLWWIWATQVIYNTSFRTKDWMHRIFAILQFGIFGSMATFTGNFNIFVGLSSSNSQNMATPVDFRLSTSDFNSVLASSLRQERLPVLNAKGISIVMGFSRMLLSIQYAIVIFYCHRAEHHKYRHGLKIHLFTLVFSTVAYFVAIAVIGKEKLTTGHDIGKIILWFAPMVLEIVSYFYIATLDHVKINPENIHRRCANLFVVILGEELNAITGSFKYVIGTVGFTIKGAGLMASAAIIVIGEFSLYTRNNWKKWGGLAGTTNRTLLWFFTHYLLMAYIIVALQGVRSLLSFANLYSALNTLISLIAKIAEKTYYGTHKVVTKSMFPEANSAFTALGLPFDDFIVIANEALSGGITNLTSVTKIAKTFVYVGCITANEFDAFPQPGSDFYNKLQKFLNATVVDPHEVYPLIGDFLSTRLHWAFYFWGAAGGTLVLLAIMSVMKQRPTDKYECASVMSRFIFGFIFITLSSLTAHHNQPYYANGTTAVLDPRPSKPWMVASSSWLIPGFALTLIVVNFIDIVLEYYALSRYGGEDLDDAIETKPLTTAES